MAAHQLAGFCWCPGAESNHRHCDFQSCFKLSNFSGLSLSEAENHQRCINRLVPKRKTCRRGRGVTYVPEGRAKFKDQTTWDTIPARVVPKDVEERKVAILLADQHVAGKIQWKAHEKAGMIFRMSRELKMSLADIATYLRQSKTTVIRFLDAYS